MKRQRTLEDELYRVGLVILGALAVGIPCLYLFLSGRDLTLSVCLFRLLFGIYCPGCGGTRSVNALLHGHLLESLWYHPLVLYCAVLYLCFMVTWTAAKFHVFGLSRGIRFRSGYLYGMLVIVGGNFILKNILKFYFGIVML